MTTAIKGKVNVGLFAFGVRLQKATESTRRAELDSLCEKGHKPKQRIECEPCQKTWTSWQKVPMRGYPKDGHKEPGGYKVLLSTTEIEAAKRSHPPIVTFEVGKLVDWDALTVLYGFGESYYVTPEEDVVSAKLYQVFLQALGPTRRAMLTKFSVDGVPARFAFVANVGRRLLMALKLYDLRENEFVPPPVAVSDFEALPVKAMLDDKYDPDATFPADEDRVQDLIDERFEAALAQAVEAGQGAVEKPLEARTD